MKFSKKNLLLITFVGVFVILFSTSFIKNPKFKNILYAQNPATEPVFGSAWAPNIGWIIFDDGVRVTKPGGLFVGYAWSPNVGWIDFGGNDISECGSSAERPAISTSNGNLSGFARVLSMTGADYSGCINLDKVTIDSVSGGNLGGNFTGWAWGGNSVGWIDFSGVSVAIEDPVSVNISANPNRVSSFPANVTISWNSNNADYCDDNGSGWFDGDFDTDGSREITGLNSETTFSVRCYNDDTNDVASTSVILEDTVVECNDGIDNDGDGLVDSGGDSGCSNDSDTSESDLGVPIFEEF